MSGTGSDLLAMEDMFAVIPHTTILCEVIEKNCPGIKLPATLSEKLSKRNHRLFEVVAAYRNEHPIEFVALHETMLVFSFVNADPSADANVQGVLDRFLEAKKLCDDYKIDMLPGVKLGAECAAVVYLNVVTCDDARMAWSVIREDAITRMENHLNWGRWYNVETVTRSLDEMIVAKTKFENDYRRMRIIERPNFDVDVIPVPLPGKHRFVIEMSPPIQPTKEDERNPETGHFNITHNRNVCQVMFEYDVESEFVRMTHSRYGDDSYILEHMLKDVLGTKIIPMVPKVRHLDCFNSADYTDRLVIPTKLGLLRTEVQLSSIDLSHGEAISHYSYAPIKIHDFHGANIYEQIDRILPPTRFPPSLRVIHSVEIKVRLWHMLKDGKSVVPSGKTAEYTITLKPKRISVSPNIDNPNKVKDRQHAEAIRELIRCWQLEGTPVNQA